MKFTFILISPKTQGAKQQLLAKGDYNMSFNHEDEGQTIVETTIVA